MRQVALLAALICLVPLALAQCQAPKTSDTVPTNPGIPSGLDTASPKVYAGCSELVDVATMGPYYPWTDWMRTDCPHLRSGLTNFESAFPSLGNGANAVVTVPTLLRSCSVSPSVVLNRITVKAGAALIFDDADITLQVREIFVEEGGELLIGSETCRLFSSVTITFHGTSADSSHDNGQNGQPPSATSKGILSWGNVDIHGKRYHPTWTRLARPAKAASDIIYLQDNVNWEVGQQILITTTTWFDCPAEYQDQYCKPCFDWQNCQSAPHQNELRTIVAISIDETNHEYALKLNSPITYDHYAGMEYQAEVALLSRRINLSGVNSGDGFGGHSLVRNNGRGRFSGVRAENMGQTNVAGRYPFHLHLLGTTPHAAASYFQDCSITNSLWRGIVIHGSNATRLSRNVAYNVKGMCYYLEDGVEEDTLVEYNLAAHVHPIREPADGDGGQGGAWFDSASDLFLPADTSAAGFYVPNAYNTFIGNAASGGWSGFAFPNTPLPLGNYQAENWYANNPSNRPFKRFYSNTAHSSGFYWNAHGSCMYVGAKLFYEGGVLKYNSGRNSRTTTFSNGTTAWMLFEDTKVFLCGKGIAHWGDQIQIVKYEAHDILVSSMLFGEAAMARSLITGRTPNTIGWTQIESTRYTKMGFQFYDTWVKTILDRITFRNYPGGNALNGKPTYVIRYMDHSDHFTPQGINSVRGLQFQNVDPGLVVGIQNCGADCGDASQHVTMSAMIYGVYDYDGTMSGSGKPSIMGSNLDWWNVDDSTCDKHPLWKLWRCDWTTNREIGFVPMWIDGLMDGCDYAKFSDCTDQFASYTVGRVSQFGRPTRGLDIRPWPGVSGISNTGWYWRPKSTPYGIDGAPSAFKIADSIQLPRGNFVVLAISYPAGAQFRVNIYNRWWGITYPNIAATTLANVLTPTETLLPIDQFKCTTGTWSDFCETTGGIGPAWHFNGQHLYLRVVTPACYNKNQYKACAAGFYEYDGVRVNDIFGGFEYQVTVTSCSGCSVQSSFSGINYYTAPDVSPPVFAAEKGTLRSNPSTVGAGFRECELPPDANPITTGTSTTGTLVVSTGAISTTGTVSSAAGTTGTDVSSTDATTGDANMSSAAPLAISIATIALFLVALL